MAIGSLSIFAIFSNIFNDVFSIYTASALRTHETGFLSVAFAAKTCQKSPIVFRRFYRRPAIFGARFAPKTVCLHLTKVTDKVLLVPHLRDQI